MNNLTRSCQSSISKSGKFDQTIFRKKGFKVNLIRVLFTEKRESRIRVNSFGRLACVTLIEQSEENGLKSYRHHGYTEEYDRRFVFHYSLCV